MIVYEGIEYSDDEILDMFVDMEEKIKYYEKTLEKRKKQLHVACLGLEEVAKLAESNGHKVYHDVCWDYIFKVRKQ